jgi:alkaline phosphatase D
MPRPRTIARERAQFTDFKPFWEFVGGPINAGTFGPGEIDRTFGPDVRFVSIGRHEAEPLAGRSCLQFFGIGKIDARSKTLTVTLHNTDGKEIYKVELSPEA